VALLKKESKAAFRSDWVVFAEVREVELRTVEE
jgi:hypothetical protein